MKLSQKIIEKFEYNEFYENFPAVILSLKLIPGRPTNCLFISENCKEYLGYPANDLMKDWSLFEKSVSEKDWRYIKINIDDSIRLNQKFQVKFRYEFRPGITRWLRLNANVLIKHDYTELQGILSDITEEKNIELKEDKLKNALINIARHPVINNGDVEQLPGFCAKIISETLDICRSGLWYYSAEKNSLRCDKLYIKDLDTFASGFEVAGNEHPEYFSTLREAPYILANDARNNETTKCFSASYLRPNNIFSLLDIPVFYKGNIVAVLCQEQTKKIRIWQKSEINFLFQVGEFVSYCFAVCERNRFESEMTYINGNLQKLVNEKTEELRKKTIELEQKNKEILESISYSGKIQASILPGQTKLKQLFRDFFIFYNPKTIVAGDFYWVHETDNTILFAVCDCTGHGIPGAFVSIMAYKILERTVTEFKLSEPEQILKKANELFNLHFNRPDIEVKDGMDIGLIQLKKISPEETKLKYSGAYLPAYVATEKTNFEIRKIETNRTSLGFTDQESDFKHAEMTLKTGSLVFLFTDGCYNQFGGQKGKKLKQKNLLSLIQKNITGDLNSQHTSISNELKKWQGNYDQLDDMCLACIKI